MRQASVGERVAEARKRQFIGRDAEHELFRSALSSLEPSFCFLYFYGPGGVGKTTLLQSFVDICPSLDVKPLYLDARNIEPSPNALLNALRSALMMPPEEFPNGDPISVLNTSDSRHVVLLDTFELLDGLQAWFQNVFLPHLSANVLLVAAGRQAPQSALRLDSGWREIVRTGRLENFSREESRAYLERRAFSAKDFGAAIEFTHGHPLALSLLADLHSSLPRTAELSLMSDKMASPEVVDVLLKRFIAETPRGLRKSALEACAVARIMNETLLRELLFPTDGTGHSAPNDSDDAHTLFAWLRSLSFMDAGPSGLFPHDIAREVLQADLRWRDPEWYAELHRRARNYYIHQLKQASGEQQQKRFLYDGVFLHRDNAIVRAAFTWQETPAFRGDHLKPTDIDPIVQMVASHEGSDAARAARHWLHTQPEATVVFRAVDGSDEPAAFFMMLALHKMSSADWELDPATQAIQSAMDTSGPLRENEEATCLRFWMARDTYQGVSPLQSLLIVHTLRHFLTSGAHIAYTFFCCHDTQSWQAIFDYAEIPQAAEFQVGEKTGFVFGRDWRRFPLSHWLETIGEKETTEESKQSGTLTALRPAESAPYIALSQSDFAAAIQNALRHWERPEKLRANPLLHSRVVTLSGSQKNANTIPASPDGLKKLLYEIVETLNTPGVRTQRGYLALRHTYLTPAPTQDAAADRLGLPFSTYRRHLAEGIAALTDVLWNKEINVSTN